MWSHTPAMWVRNNPVQICIYLYLALPHKRGPMHGCSTSKPKSIFFGHFDCPPFLFPGIYQVSELLNITNIIIEAWRGKSGPTQCHRCQSFRQSSWTSHTRLCSMCQRALRAASTVVDHTLPTIELPRIQGNADTAAVTILRIPIRAHSDTVHPSAFTPPP